MENKPDTLVVITPAFPGSGEDLYLVLSQQLLVRSIKKIYPELKVVVVSLFYPEKKSRYHWYGAEVISVGKSKWKMMRPFDRARVRSILNSITKKNNVIGILSFWLTECAFHGKNFTYRKKLKHFTWICGQDARKTNKWVNLIKPVPGELIAMSPFLAMEFEKNHGIRPAHIILNAIEPALFDPSTDQHRDIDILGAGSLIPLKQYDQFIEVIAVLKESFPNLRVKLSGEGNERNKLARRINVLGLSNNIEMPGSTPHTELLKLMQRSRIFLHSSSYEGCSTVCLEALYAGAQVISYCYPFDKPIPYWHVVKDQQQMTAKALELLSTNKLEHSPVLIHSMDETAKEIMNLFEQL